MSKITLPPLPTPRAWMMEWTQHSPSFTCDKSDYVSWEFGKARYPDNLKDLFTAEQMQERDRQIAECVIRACAEVAKQCRSGFGAEDAILAMLPVKEPT